MKKITFKISAFLFLAMLSFQVKAQTIHTEIVEGTQYNLRNAETDQYLRVNGNSAAEGEDPTPSAEAQLLTMVDYPAPGVNDYHLNWSFVTVVAADDGLSYWNVQAQARGMFRFGGGGFTANGLPYSVISTAFQGPRDNSDKVHVVTYDADAGGFRIFNKTGSRALAPVTNDDGAVVLISEANADVVGKSDIWVLEVSEMTEPVASTTTFSIDAFSISNPVNNQLVIKGATSKVQQLSLYSVLGNTVLSKSVNVRGDISLDVSSLSNGLYILEMAGENGERFTKKIIKQ